jgi:hypothetical protein
MPSRKYATKTRGRPFKPGNAGKPPGARHKTTLAVESLLEGEAEKLTRKVIRLALAGDTTALRLCLERIAPVRRGRPVRIALPGREDRRGRGGRTGDRCNGNGRWHFDSRRSSIRRRCHRNAAPRD